MEIYKKINNLDLGPCDSNEFLLEEFSDLIFGVPVYWQWEGLALINGNRYISKALCQSPFGGNTRLLKIASIPISDDFEEKFYLSEGCHYLVKEEGQTYYEVNRLQHEETCQITER